MKPALVSLILAAALLAAGFGLYRSGLARFNYPSAARFPVRGIDVSHHQGRIDWRSVRAAGIEFAFIKATEGGDRQDGEFARNWEEAGRAGIPRGAYHFFTFCTPGLTQARNFAGAIGHSTGELAPVADVEFSGNCAAPPAVSEIRTELRAFLDDVGRALGRRPMLYRTSEAERRILASEFGGELRWPRNVFGEPGDPAWQFWQFADNGRIPGISTLVDLDVFSGSRSRFEELVRAGSSPPARP